jgi:hypothetical protein
MYTPSIPCSGNTNLQLGGGLSGLGCRGRLGGCGCGGTCAGLGLFDSGMDFTTWGWPEWGIVGVGIYAALSMLGDTKRGFQRARRIGKAVRKANPGGLKRVLSEYGHQRRGGTPRLAAVRRAVRSTRSNPKRRRK